MDMKKSKLEQGVFLEEEAKRKKLEQETCLAKSLVVVQEGSSGDA